VGRLRFGLAALGALALIAATLPPLALSVNVTRTSSALLSPVTIGISLRNASQTSIIATFLTTDLYEVQIRDANTQLFSSLFGHKSIDIERRIPLPAGTTSLGSLVWDATTNDHRSLDPGTYIVRVNILGSLVHPSADLPIVFATPMAVASANAAKEGAEITVAGVSQFSGNVPILVGDDGETIRTSRLARPRAQGRYIVRGYITKTGGTTTLNIERALPAFDNLDPEASPPPPRPLMSFPPIPPTPRTSR
jgi:hypothetical protein